MLLQKQTTQYTFKPSSTDTTLQEVRFIDDDKFKGIYYAGRSQQQVEALRRRD